MRVHTAKKGHLHVSEHATRAGEERLVGEGPLLTPESSTHYSLTDAHCANQQNHATW
jgi:DNA-binding transcriptional regulator PaaX